MTENQTNQPVVPVLDKAKLILPGAIVLAAILISGTILYTKGAFSGLTGQQGSIEQKNGNQPPVKVDVSADDDPVLGNANVPVTVIEFSDFQCPFCRQFWRDTFSQLKKEYIDTGKIKLVYRDFPLTSIHPSSLASALAGECAHSQGKFWQFHDAIFEGQDKQGTGTITYTVDDIKKWAQQAGLAMPAFNSCLDAKKYDSEVQKDIADGTKAGVSGTPAFFINGQSLLGAQPFNVFKQIIDQTLTAK